MRLFFALPLPPLALAAAGAAQARLREAAGSEAQLSFPAAAQLHVTLAFLGEVPDGAPAAEVGRAVFADVRAFEVSLEGAGTFPGGSRAHAVWVGIGAGSAEVSGLVERLRPALAARGLATDLRPFQPHLTVARVKPGGARDARRALAALPRGEMVRFRADRLTLLRSEQRSGGAVHHLVEEFPLRG
jgi:2'-5' RNA ligase